MNATGPVRERDKKKTTVYLPPEYCMELMRQTGTTSINAAINKTINRRLQRWIKERRSTAQEEAK